MSRSAPTSPPTLFLGLPTTTAILLISAVVITVFGLILLCFCKSRAKASAAPGPTPTPSEQLHHPLESVTLGLIPPVFYTEGISDPLMQADLCDRVLPDARVSAASQQTL
jgi:hypothetical protein